jgi:hypothetical protein
MQKPRTVATPKQRVANRANSLKSTGPRSELGKFRAKLNATKHGLSLPLDERAFADQIKTIAQLIRDDCDTDAQAAELAKRIIDFERNEAFLQDFNQKAIYDEITDWGIDSDRITLTQLAQARRNGLAATMTFTLPQKDHSVKLKGKDRVEEIKFIEGFLKFEERGILAKVREAKNSHLSAQRYQKRAINQLVKGIKTVANGEEF